MDINEVTLLGSIKKFSNILILKNGQRYCLFDVFTSIPFQKKDGGVGYIQDNHRVIAYGEYASVIKKKGSVDQKIFIRGRLKVTNWRHGDTFFEKEFIVLERFKLYPSPQSEPKEPENYNPQQDMQDEEEYEDESESIDVWHDPEADILADDLSDDMNELDRERTTGWPYGDNTDEDLLISWGADIDNIATTPPKEEDDSEELT